MTTENKIARRDFLKQAGGAAAAAAVWSPAISALAQGGAPATTVALIGCAHIHTPEYMGVLHNRKSVKVKYVWDHKKPRAEHAAAQLEGDAVEDVAKIWADPEVKAVVICSETNRHHDLVLGAAAAKKHTFAEKPLGITARESFEMAAALEQAGVLFTTGYFKRCESANLFLKQQVEKGAFGKITRVRGSNCHSGSLGRWFDSPDLRWMADPKVAGVGAFGDLGTHSLDILMWLFGEVEAVTADIKVVVGNYGDCDESGEALMHFKSGITGTLAAGWVDVDDPVTLLISGTKGHAVLDRGQVYFKSELVPGADGRPVNPALMPPAIARPMFQFLDAVEGKAGAALVRPAEAAARVSVMEAAYKAAKNRTWVSPETA